MPLFSSYYVNKEVIYRQAEQQVAKKFPALVKNTSGWYRAVENRFKRLYK